MTGRIFRAMPGVALALVLSAPPYASAASGGETVEIVGTEFRITRADGRVVTGDDLVGLELRLGGAGRAPVTVRIAARRPDPLDPTGETILYDFRLRDRATGRWKRLCRPGPAGLAMGFPLSGVWTREGAHVRRPGQFSLTCTSGASAKCVRMGYKPWRSAPDGTSLWDYHQACTRLMRADYCGDGTPHTRPGMPVVVYDRLGIRRAGPSRSLGFEAGWAADGAVCVRKVRVKEKATLERLARACPDRLGGRVGPACTERAARRNPATLLINRSE